VSEHGRGAMGWYRSNYYVSGGCLLSLCVCRRSFQDLLKVRSSSVHVVWVHFWFSELVHAQWNLDLSFFKGMEKTNEECGKTIQETITHCK
jgi:hypothetical protein